MVNNPAPKACHNCRRRRLKCDRTVPTCQKCHQIGQECLGYGKLFLWNQGVASRGRMMGKSYPPSDSPIRDDRVALASGRASANSSRQDAEMVIPLSPALLDPLFDGLDAHSRRYLLHFATHLSSDMIIADITDSNPFRNLIPLARDHPILRHALVANAALHLSCLQSRAINPSTSIGQSAEQAFSSVEHTRPASQALVDAFSAKQKALVLLRQALADISNIDVNLVVTVVHLFIIFELIGPGEDEWRAHVQGALRLISYLQTLECNHASPVAAIQDSITSDCLTYYVLGSTLMNTSTLSDPFLFPGDIIASLTRAEANSYLSLPTPLLQILFKACELSNRITASLTSNSTNHDSLIETANTLLNATQSFDVISWAKGLEGSSSSRTLSRIHAALAHQNAMRIYICRSIDQIHPLGEDTEALVANIISHVSFVGVDDPIFKATSWPTFMAGAETDNPVSRQWAVDRLHEFWTLIPWGYLKTAEEAIRTTWRLRDESSLQNESVSWIQQLKALERYWLIA